MFQSEVKCICLYAIQAKEAFKFASLEFQRTVANPPPPRAAVQF